MTLLLVLLIFLSGVLRGMAGFGFALAAVPLLSMFMPPLEAVAIGILLQVALGVLEVGPLFKQAHKSSLLPLAVGSLLGTPFGLLALSELSPDTARLIIAIAIFLGILVLLRQPKSLSKAGRRTGFAVSAGVVSGLFSGLAAIPGPPAVAFYLGTGIPANQMRASLLIFCFFTVVVALPGLFLSDAITEGVLWICILGFPAVKFGTFLGEWVFKRMAQSAFRRLAIVLMAASGAIVGWQGLTGLLLIDLLP